MKSQLLPIRAPAEVLARARAFRCFGAAAN
jgi:hypothetical protein